MIESEIEKHISNLRCACDCDGRGCSICLGADELERLRKVNSELLDRLESLEESERSERIMKSARYQVTRSEFNKLYEELFDGSIS